MSSLYLEENNQLLKQTFEILTEQILLITNQIKELENKIDNINFNFKIIEFINKENYKYEIDWNSIHLY